MASPAALFGTGVVVLGSAFGISKYVKAKDEAKRKAKKKKKKTTGSKRPTFAENAALGNSPAIVKEVVLPIELGELGPVSVRMPTTGDVVSYSTLDIRTNEVLGDGKVLPITAQQAIAGLVTNMGAATTKIAWDSLKQHVRLDGGTTFDAPSASLDQSVVSVLGQVDSQVKWSTTPKAGSAESKLWAGVVLLGELMYQSIWNTYADEQSEPGGGGSDGGGSNGGGTSGGSTTNNAKIQKQWDNWYALGDLKGVIKIVSESTYAPNDNFTSEIKVFEDDMTRQNGNFTGVGNYDTGTDDGLFVLYGTDPADVQERMLNTLKAKEATL